ncbi:tight adherence pilus pseudopilin TadF [Tatumella ptyseos]|uniref:tight adherence pilus pseudopilin TadF n=1 Tax=Tatumella ptyseos TaxID=82987 RepID=UPI0026EDBBC4|nr:tight adherence pilus pseudopilin TadF [Tatumella ptyseos]WKX27270.1 tight adherence pilus pseudopilin TadF [Tatumella ptyseos]
MKKRFFSLLIGNKGSVFIEAAFIFTFLSILTVGLLEYGTLLVLKSQVERVNYSIASVIRERSELYSKNDAFTTSEMKEIYELTKALTYHRYDKELCIRIESVHFKAQQKKVISHQQSENYGSSLCNKLNTTPISKKIEFSPLSSRNRWLPMYQVSLIIPTPAGSLNKLLKKVDALPETVSAHTLMLVR